MFEYTEYTSRNVMAHRWKTCALFCLIENPPAMPVVAGDGKKALAAAKATIQKSSSVLN